MKKTYIADSSPRSPRVLSKLVVGEEKTLLAMLQQDIESPYKFPVVENNEYDTGKKSVYSNDAFNLEETVEEEQDIMFGTNPIPAGKRAMRKSDKK